MLLRHKLYEVRKWRLSADRARVRPESQILEDWITPTHSRPNCPHRRVNWAKQSQRGDLLVNLMDRIELRKR